MSKGKESADASCGSKKSCCKIRGSGRRLSETEKSKKKTSPCQKRVYCIAGDLYSCHWACRWNNILDKVWADKETYDLNKYFGITAKSQMGVTINNEVLDAQAITEGGTAYLSYNLVQDYISDRFYWDSNEHILCIHCREIW